MRSSLCLSLVLTAVLLLSCKADWECKNSGPCHCREKNFTIELESVVKRYFSDSIKDPNSGNERYSYMVSLCNPMSCNRTNPTIDKTAAACQFISDQDTSVKLGQVTGFSWSVKSQTEFSITYTDGEPISGGGKREIRVDFTVDKANKPGIKYDKEYIDNTGTHTYVFNATITPQEEDQALSNPSKAGVIGLVLIIVFMLSILGYFLIGSIIMYAVKGARGTEVIPNYNFWKTLPLLIKDGCMFTVSPCVKNSGYQSL